MIVPLVQKSVTLPPCRYNAAEQTALSYAFVTAPFLDETQVRKGFVKICELIEKEGFSTEKLRKPQ